MSLQESTEVVVGKMAWVGREDDSEARPSHPQRSGERLEAFAAAVARDRPGDDTYT